MRNLENYMERVRDNLQQHQKELDHLKAFTAGKFWVEAYTVLGKHLSPVMEFPHMETMPCFIWCYDNDIHYKLVIKETTMLSANDFTPIKFLFIEFKDKASMVAFKLKWQGNPDEAAGISC